jgi:hypothetical protein
MIWLLMAANAHAAAVSVPRDGLADYLTTVNTAVSGKLAVGGNWDTYKAVKKAVAETGLDIERLKIGDTDGMARTDMEKYIDKENLTCGLAVRVETDATFSVLEVGACKPAATVPPPLPAPPPSPPRSGARRRSAGAAKSSRRGARKSAPA